MSSKVTIHLFLAKNCFFSLFLIRLVFDKSSQVHPVLEHREGSIKVTEQTEILVSNIDLDTMYSRPFQQGLF